MLSKVIGEDQGGEAEVVGGEISSLVVSYNVVYMTHHCTYMEHVINKYLFTHSVSEHSLINNYCSLITAISS